MPRTLPRLSREQRSSSPQPAASATPPAPVPTIRLISATPSAHGSAADTSTTHAGLSFASSYVNVPAVSSPLAPKPSPSDENAAPSTKRRLVPKRSKLGLLGGRSKDRDMSDVVRRVGGNAASSGRGGFEIYVDPTQDPDLGDILLVKKKKSRATLGGVGWGTLGERTNAPAVPKEREGKEGLKIKTDEAQKWWTIGRGRKDSKEKKQKGKRSKSPEPSSAARFNSLDSGIMLSSPACFESEPVPSPQIPSIQAQTLRAEPIRHTSDPIPSNDASPAFLAPPGAPAANGSIALRAMRSMRSMARLGSWAPPLTASGTTNTNNNNTLTKKDKEEAKKEKKKKKKEGRAQTLRLSGSSFEAGGLTSPDCAQFADKDEGTNKKKQTVLGLGLPSTMRFGSARVLSTTSNASSNRLQHPAINRLSNSSSVNLAPVDNRPRSGSEASSVASARPLSTSSGMSGASSSSSTGSVKWDDDRLETVKERAAHERAAAHRQAQIKQAARSETRHTSEGRRRAALVDIFPDAMVESRRTSQASSVPMPHSPPIVTIEEATTDGHEGMDSSFETPQKRARTRPISEQVGMRERPKAICDDVDGVLSILDAATNDLASLINRLDLQATPGTPNTPDNSPLRLPQRVSDLLSRSPSLGSPIKRAATMSGSPIKQAPGGLRTSLASVTSLRPYAQSRGSATASDPKAPATWARLGQQIAPWPISPTKPSPPRRSETAPAPSIPSFRLTHKRTLSPAPLADGPIVFRPLQPAKAKSPVSNLLASGISPLKGTSTPPAATAGVPSSVTFGSSKPRRMADLSSVEERAEAPSPSPVFRKAQGPKLSLETDTQARAHSPVPLSPEARKGLGLAGTLGEEEDEEAVYSDDPDSDIPNELQVILSGQPDGDTDMLEDTLSFRPPQLPSPGSPPGMPLPTPEVSHAMDVIIPDAPVFRAQLVDEEDHFAELDGSEAEDDTKKSFDFTGELQRLNESGAGERRSFVEQLESAFRTPAKFDLDGFGEFSVADDAPPVPAFDQSSSFVSQSVPESVSVSMHDSQPSMEMPSVPLPLLPSAEISDLPVARKTKSSSRSKTSTKSRVSTKSKPSDGQLDVNFRFGGKASTKPSPEKEAKPLTLSDIISPPAHVRSLSMSSLVEEDSSLLKSIFAKAADIPSPAVRRRVNSDTSSKRRSRVQMLRDESMNSHSRGSSQASFSGMESFGEVRRGFEFPSDRPTWYPPPQASARRGHNKEESVFSIASVSSYGMVLNPGSNDPFDYGQYPMPNRPSSDDMSFAMSMSVDDTFSFMHHRDSRRPRVDSDASSFYFRAPGSNQVLQPLKRGHRQQDSVMSTTSIAPPVSLYNRSFGGHRRNDSNSSASSVAIAYAKYGAGSRSSWVRAHRRDMSVDSVVSDMSALRVSRPGLGDKMLESALDYGMPLTSISASPPESVIGERLGNRTSFDSIIDGEPRSSAEDSLFEKTGHRTSVSSESVFGDDEYGSYRQFRVPQFRPLSIISMDQSGFPSPKREDDTMITMLDGDHVRRRSIGSMYEGSPCVRVNKRKHAATRGPQHRVAGSEGEIMESPNKARIVEKPSIASSSYSRFGNDHMALASKGLLERQSLEENCLVADGEDHPPTFRHAPVFTRPMSANRSRSSTYTASSSGAETPPLSISDGSSQSSESQSSIDLSHVNAMLANMTHPSNGDARNRVRARARGHGHRRRASAARASRTSVYETIEEEISIDSPPRDRFLPGPEKTALSPVADNVMIVDGDDNQSMEWDDERGVVALRKFYALKDEAHVTVEESRRMWLDTPFSIYAVQSFDPPDHPSGMQALLEHSKHAYGPLASELRPRRVRSRTHSRPSPYPCTSKTSHSPASRPTEPERKSTAPQEVVYQPSPLQQRVFDANIRSSDVSPFVPGKSNKNSFGLPSRPRVGSNARRTALGWAKRSTGKENKENTSQGTIATPGDSLRISRPRPRGRPTPAAPRPQTIRV